MNQDLSMYRPAAFSIIYGLENTETKIRDESQENRAFLGIP
jgi:hypothetical protein